MGTWPIVARGALLDTLVEGLTRTPPRSQLLRGPSGVGKTTLAAAVSAALAARGRTIVPVVALAELREVPLGALAPLLASSSVAEHADIAVRLSELVAIVGRHADSYLLVVDDAPLLDPASAAALYQLVRVFAVPTLLTARDEHALTGAAARLLHEDLVTVTELEGLSLDETRTVLRRHLGADPRPESLQRLFGATSGNPLFLRELTLAAERSDRVRPGPYGIEIDPVRLPAHVLETVAGRLADLRPEQRRLAELIALAQPWPPAATRPDEQGIVSDLLDAGVLALAEPADAGYLHLAHPVYVEALLAGLSADERAERRRTAATRLLALDEEPLRFTALCLLSDGGGVLSPADLVWAAEYAHLAGDHGRAVQAAERALDLAPDAHAALIRASALSALGGDPAATDAAFAQAAELAVDAEARARVEVRWGQHTALRAHDPARAVERASAVLPALGDAAGLLTPDLAKWRLMAGDATALDTPLAPQTDADPAAALNAAIGMAMMATMAGRVDDARQAVAAGRPLADRFAAVQPFAGGLLDLSEFLAHVAEGRIAEAREFAEQRRRQPFADSAGVWSYALALVHLHAGRLHDALPLALLAIEQLRWRDFTGLVGPAIALGATVHAQLGEVEPARALLDALQPAHRDDVKVVLQAAEAEAWLAVVADDPGRATGMLVPAVARGVELGHLLLAALTASVAVRIGPAAEVRGLLAAAASASGSPLITGVAQLAAAAADRDASAVVDLAPDLERAGLVATVQATLERAAEWAGDDRMLERRARVRAAELGLTIVPVRTARSARSETGLTEREWVIAQAAARRERSREIADRLGVSVRTVDNHLASVYRKLGISGRAELEDELRGRL
ncbi:LuxR C-terminal-related transcriptional regulator [Microcella sp.]|uniref:helix-turn-helix transcriptional regulator n=1 Tax=Microcella sp. TaxID=1913979 RepID=UPI003F6E595C